jgi:hypothetical protein
MEEEIPTALYLLRRIPKTYFKSKLPGLNYEKFVWMKWAMKKVSNSQRASTGF